MKFAFHGSPQDSCMATFAKRLAAAMQESGHELSEPVPGVGLVFSHVDPEHIRPFRRHAQATYIIALLRLPEHPDDFLRAAYPYMIRSLANLLIAVVGPEAEEETYFLTLERGYYRIAPQLDPAVHVQEVVSRLTPLATSHLIIDNVFDPDLEPELWQGDGHTAELGRAGEILDAWNLLPAPFPMQEILSPDDFRHVQRLYQIGGLSYGNLSQRRDRHRYWMSASGVNKAHLHDVGQEILMVKDFDEGQKAMRLSVPPEIKPRRVSVDAIEHFKIYREHPQVGAIMHVHAWMEGIPSTDVNYPCGTIELATAVADLVRRSPDPSRAVVGLRNHGMTITGRSLDDIMERVDGKILPQVPMS